jgi:hypothetical protein
MKFRLTYEGELRPSQKDAIGSQPEPLALHKHKIRQHFHGQLRELWATNRFLREHKVYGSDYGYHIASGPDTFWRPEPSEQVPLRDALVKSGKNSAFGFNFLPLVWERFSLLCSLDILFLRRDIPGSAISAGDIDNRIKTLIDGLRRPRNEMELMHNGTKIVPEADEDPFFCLLEDDKQVSHISLETDTLLDTDIAPSEDKSVVRLIITVELRPYDVTTFNLNFV